MYCYAKEDRKKGEVEEREKKKKKEKGGGGNWGVKRFRWNEKIRKAYKLKQVKCFANIQLLFYSNHVKVTNKTYL